MTGNYNYGYSNPNSAKHEVKTPDGVVTGTYSYVDANNILQTVNYVSDEHGFRVAATNLPVGPGPAVAPVQHQAAVVPAAKEVVEVGDEALDIRGNIDPTEY